MKILRFIFVWVRFLFWGIKDVFDWLAPTRDTKIAVILLLIVGLIGGFLIVQLVSTGL